LRLRIEPGGRISGTACVPGDKSIAHRWLILAATGVGPSELRDLPPSLDVVSTARCLAALASEARGELEGWLAATSAVREAQGFTPNKGEARGGSVGVVVHGEGRARLEGPGEPLDCANSGTTMRLLAGVLASLPFETHLTGDTSLRARPMERVAVPLRAMGATVRTTDGHPPIEVDGAALNGIDHRTEVPSAQVKGAVLLAGLDAEGPTTVRESAPTRDHTERALGALGAPVSVEGGAVRIERFAPRGFSGRVPGDISSASYLIGAAALSGGELTLADVGLNPTRVHFLRVLERMGVRTEMGQSGVEVGEPVGELFVAPGAELRPTSVAADELPLVIDEVTILAALAAHAAGETRFRGGAELRLKESDRLGGLADGLRDLGGDAAVEGDDLVVGGGGLGGGTASAGGDHRMAMALAVAALAARGPCTIEGIEAAAVSFPGFAGTLAELGARVQVDG
jgi:3-phosphoshikimate 1-carboxyvinyltransferase